MNEFTVNIGPKLARQTGVTTQVLSAIVPDPPREIRALDSGTILKGVVQGRDSDGLTIIATDKGSIKVAVNPPPATGSIVTLEIRIAGDRLQVLILATDSPTAAGAKNQESASNANPGASNSATSGTNRAGSTASQPSTPSAPPPGPAAIVHQTGAIVEAVLLKVEETMLRQLAIAGAGRDASLAAAPSPATRALPGAGAPEPSPPRTPPQALANVLGSDLRAQIAALFEAAKSPTPSTGPRQPSTGATNAEPFRIATAILSTPSAQTAGVGAQSGVGAVWSALPNGAEIRIKLTIDSVVEANPALGPKLSPASAHAEPGSLSGRILGHTPSGGTIVATPIGAVVLKRDLALPVDTSVLLSLDPNSGANANPLAPPAPALTAQQILLQASRGWLSFAEAFAAIRAMSAGGALPDPAPRMAQPGPRLAADILRGVDALRRGDLEALLGAAAKQWRAAATGKDEPLSRARAELAQLSRYAGEVGGLEWKCYFIPIWDEGTLRQINLFYRRDRSKGQGPGGKKEAGARFVVDVDFTKLGAFQFDGLVRERRFDLMVRSRIPLPAEMRRGIAQLFQEALELGRYKGEVGFQTLRDFPVAPLDEIVRHATAVSA